MLGVRLDGKRALVTGGSRSLGRAIAVELARCGARVALTYKEDRAGAEETVAAIRAAGGEARACQVDVLSAPATAGLLKELDGAWGTTDILVNNAGVSQNLSLALLEEDDWDHVLDTNLKGAYLTARAAARGMIRRKAGVILNIGSLAGERILDAPIHYCSSKAGVRGLTQSLAKELARHNIRVLCLAPGLLEDGVGRNLPDHRLADYLAHCALGRVGTLEEVARLAAFLVSDGASYMTGETIVMDGGL
jgi:NAD(P)-dependent dehydrogenase (short-subunit alcohol dehydrogenase family)